MQYPKKSDRIKSIVDIANYLLGFRTQADEIHEMLNLKYAQNTNWKTYGTSHSPMECEKLNS